MGPFHGRLRLAFQVACQRQETVLLFFYFSDSYITLLTYFILSLGDPPVPPSKEWELAHTAHERPGSGDDRLTPIR
jgi:hypothetical protein